MSTPTSFGQYTARAARRAEQDKQLRDTADRFLEDPQRVGLMTTALTTASPRVQSYSQRNQALLYTQCQDRGIALTDVATYRQWAERGRQVRKGQRALRIVAPAGRPADEGSTDSAQQADQPNEDITENEQDHGEQRRFRMISIFAHAQTEPIEPLEPTATLEAPTTEAN